MGLLLTGVLVLCIDTVPKESFNPTDAELSYIGLTETQIAMLIDESADMRALVYWEQIRLLMERDYRSVDLDETLGL